MNADNRLPASHRLVFLLNSLLLSAAPVYLFSQIFDMAIPENAVVFGGVSVVSAVMLTMACQIRSKGLVAKLINKRGIELTSSIQLKVKGAQDDKAKAKLKVIFTPRRLSLVCESAPCRSCLSLLGGLDWKWPVRRLPRTRRCNAGCGVGRHEWRGKRRRWKRCRVRGADDDEASCMRLIWNMLPSISRVNRSCD